MSSHRETEGSLEESRPAQWEPMVLKRIGTFGDILQGFTKNHVDSGGTMAVMAIGGG